MSVQCFVLEATPKAFRWLRRYDSRDRCQDRNFCDATAYLGTVDERKSEPDALEFAPASDPRWPTACARCGKPFAQGAEYQVFDLTVYRDAQGREFTIHTSPPAPAIGAPPGAMWYADWLSEYEGWRGPDGRTLVVVCPDGHEWTIDGRASNCTEPCSSCGRPYGAHENKQQGYFRPDGCRGYQPRDGGAHRCWVRHGTPPLVTVDKNGLTCQAGAGSIQTPKWHGFLRNGVLTT